MAYFERHVQKTRKFKLKYLLCLIPLLALVVLSLFQNPSKKSLTEIPKKVLIKDAATAPAQAENTQEQGSALPAPEMDQIEKLAASDQLRKDVKVEKIWNDGTLSFKVGDDIVTVTSNGTVLYLPKEL